MLLSSAFFPVADLVLVHFWSVLAHFWSVLAHFLERTGSFLERTGSFLRRTGSFLERTGSFLGKLTYHRQQVIMTARLLEQILTVSSVFHFDWVIANSCLGGLRDQSDY